MTLGSAAPLPVTSPLQGNQRGKGEAGRQIA